MLARSFTILAAAALLAGPPAFANEDIATETVRTADLDLADAKGVAQLQRRVRHAANRVCGNASPRDLSLQASFSRCIEAALESAKDDVELAIASRSRDPIELARTTRAAR